MKAGRIARSCAVALAVTITMAPGALFAEPERTDAKFEAEEAYQRGKQQLDKKQYEEAIAELSRAYELDPLPEHLFNLGVAYHLKGDKEAAYEHYRRFLAAAPEDRVLVRNATKYMSELREGLLTERQKEIERLRAEVGRLEEEAKDAREEAQLLRSERSLPATVVVEKRGGRTSAVIASMSMVAVGLAALSAGVVYGLEARSAHSELDGLGSGGAWTVSRDWLHERGASAERNAVVFSVAGALCVAGGGAVYWYRGRGKGKTEQREVAIVPVLGPEGAGASITGSF